MEKKFNSKEYKKDFEKITYKKYNFAVRKDEKLFEQLEKYKENNNISTLIKELLNDHFEKNS